MAVDPRQLLVILGPTASGKSELALRAARESGAEILSVDSMQVYRGMDVGTAKPQAGERAEVKHHLIDVVEPNEPFTVARFVELADEVIHEASARGVPLVLTGGTPLYYKALFEGLFGGPGADEEVRQRLRALSNDDLHDRLKQIDPAAAAKIHGNDTKRMIRAIEVFELTGQPISSFQTHWTEPLRRYPATWVGLAWEKEALNRRINARVKTMISAGWVEEVRRLLSHYAPLSHTAAEATGYREVIEHVEGRLTLDGAVERIKIATRQLARRQMKWFRRFPDVTWLEGDAPVERLVEQCLAAWKLKAS
jgi:tRNA dimethylallyltransferase